MNTKSDMPAVCEVTVNKPAPRRTRLGFKLFCVGGGLAAMLPVVGNLWGWLTEEKMPDWVAFVLMGCFFGGGAVLAIGARIWKAEGL